MVHHSSSDIDERLEVSMIGLASKLRVLYVDSTFFIYVPFILSTPETTILVVVSQSKKHKIYELCLVRSTLQQ